MTKLAKLLTRERKACKLTLRQAARRSGISGPAISQMETGYIRSPSIQNVLRLAAVYEIRTDALLEALGFETNPWGEIYKVPRDGWRPWGGGR